ncbi:MAG: hypothetical protein H6716_10350 [Polyangiaceae bacterium]|nr:hypothetical protein [Polyangiaceae bacterium]
MWWVLATLPVEVQTLDAARESAPRPIECRPARTESRRSLWTNARQPSLASYCRWLARGYSTLRQDPRTALEAADKAAKLRPKFAAPHWLAGQALIAIGRLSDAEQRFDQGFKLEPAGPSAPAQLQDAARIAFLRGKSVQALELYRRLVPQASLLSSQVRRHALFVEAALVRMAAGELDIAANYLAEARQRRGAPGFSSFVLGALALVLDRQGRTAEAQAVAKEAGGPGVLLRQLQYLKHGKLSLLASLPHVPEAELHAMAAVLAESPEQAKEQWRAYLKSAPKDDRWRSHAEKKVK